MPDMKKLFPEVNERIVIMFCFELPTPEARVYMSRIHRLIQKVQCKGVTAKFELKWGIDFIMTPHQQTNLHEKIKRTRRRQ